MQKKILFCLIIFLALPVNAYYTNVQISTPDDVIPTQEFYHWITLDWNYNGPITGDQSWRECDFESPDKNYGIFITPNYLPSNALKEEFGPTTTVTSCDEYSGLIECTARTTYFFKLETFNHTTATDISLPINIRGTCGVPEVDPEVDDYTPKTATIGTGKFNTGTSGGQLKEKQEINDSKISFSSSFVYPINMNYTYNFTVNTSYKNIVPDLNVETRWGKISGFGSADTKSAELKVISHDPLDKDITGIAWIMPSDCSYDSLTSSGKNTPDMNSGLMLNCSVTGLKLLVAYATNSDDLTGYKAFLSYFSSNNNEVELTSDYSLLIGLPNVKYSFVEGLFEEHFDYKLSSIFPKTLTIIKDIGDGWAEETTNEAIVNSSIPFVSVSNTSCPNIIQQTTNNEWYLGEDFKIKTKKFNLVCQPGNHEIIIDSTGINSGGLPYNLTTDINFIVADLNINVLGMEKNPEITPTYGIIYGENGAIDLNIIIDNFSPDFIQITDANFFYDERTSGTNFIDSWSDTCTSENTTIFAETETQWKINSHLECEDSHLFYPIIYFNNLPGFETAKNTVFWVNQKTDKFKMDSVLIQNLFDSTWDPESQEVCNPKTGSCDPAVIPEDIGTGAFILPESQLTITKGDLLRFNATVTNVSNERLGGKVILIITDSQGNEAATLTQENNWTYASGGVDELTKSDFDLLFYDTEFLKENELYTATATIYWSPVNGFTELDSKPLNNIKTTNFYVMGESALENLPETNFIGIIILVSLTLIFLRKK